MAVSAVIMFGLFKAQAVKADTTDQSNQPVFFVPGAYDNNESWQNMLKMIDPNNEHTVVRFNADANGKILRQDQRIVDNGKRPYVIVLFPVNLYKEEVIAQDADALREAINQYNLKNPFTEADIVAHSNGGTISTTYLEKNSQLSSFKYHFNNLLTIGTPYNFQAGNGAENTLFLNNLIRNSGNLPSDLNVTNLIGSTPTDDSTDSVVSRDSALSGSKIFKGKVGSFQQIFLTGEYAQHGKQSDSPQVAQIIEDVLGLE